MEASATLRRDQILFFEIDWDLKPKINIHTLHKKKKKRNTCEGQVWQRTSVIQYPGGGDGRAMVPVQLGQKQETIFEKQTKAKRTGGCG
jgi:hypothetical protein